MPDNRNDASATTSIEPSDRRRGWKRLKRRLARGKPVDIENWKHSMKERSMTSWAPIGAILAPVALGAICVAPALVSGHSALGEVLRNNDSLRLLTIFTALNVATSVSGFMYMIGRHWAAGSMMQEFKKELTANALTINEVHGAVEALQSKDLQNGRKSRDVPNTWRGFSSYLAINARFLREIGVHVAGRGMLRLVPDQNWVDVWIERLRNPDLRSVEFVEFVDHENPAIAEATGRSLLRFVRLIDEIKRRDPAADVSKIKVYLVRSSEVQRSFFFVSRKVAGRLVEMVLQYSRSIRDQGDGAYFDIEAVERITDEAEIRRFRSAAGRYLRNSRSTTVAAIRSVFRDLLASDTFRALSPREWLERVEVIAKGNAVPDLGFGVVDSSSEFQITDDRHPWEVRRDAEELARRIAGRRRAL